MQWILLFPILWIVNFFDRVTSWMRSDTKEVEIPFDDPKCEVCKQWSMTASPEFRSVDGQIGEANVCQNPGCTNERVRVIK